MKTTNLKFAPFILVLLITASCGNDQPQVQNQSVSDADRVHLCDYYAADPSDPNRPEPVRGVPIQEMDLDKAEVACLDAAEQFPGGRFSYQLARVLATYDPYAALEPLGESLDAAYPAAAMGLARLYADETIRSEDRQQDAEDALSLISFAIDNGYEASEEDIAMEEAFWLQYFETVFTDENYRKPELMTALYEGRGSDINLDDPEEKSELIGIYMNIREYCGYSGNRDDEENSLFLLRGASHFFIQHAGDNILGISKFVFPSAMNRYEHDAALFVSRHGCETPVFAAVINNAEEFYEEATTDVIGTDIYQMFSRYVQQADFFNDLLIEIFTN